MRWGVEGAWQAPRRGSFAHPYLQQPYVGNGQVHRGSHPLRRQRSVARLASLLGRLFVLGQRASHRSDKDLRTSPACSDIRSTSAQTRTTTPAIETLFHIPHLSICDRSINTAYLDCSPIRCAVEKTFPNRNRPRVTDSGAGERSDYFLASSTACAAAKRAITTRYGLHET